ncbi:MAG: MarR family transcriptional regulator [Betaproteobacteria bacterium]|nr:MarR family transcriptional regulator [Betaproteobacteria bacterium]
MPKTQPPRPRKVENPRKPFERHVPGIRYGMLDDVVGYAIRRAQIAIYEEFDRELLPLKITPPRFSSLLLIENNPGLTQTQLAELIGVVRSGMVALIDFFEAEGWVRRDGKAGDRRAYHLRLTSKGAAHLAVAKARVAALEDRWSSRLTRAERRTLLALLDKVGPPRA